MSSSKLGKEKMDRSRRSDPDAGLPSLSSFRTSRSPLEHFPPNTFVPPSPLQSQRRSGASTEGSSYAGRSSKNSAALVSVSGSSQVSFEAAANRQAIELEKELVLSHKSLSHSVGEAPPSGSTVSARLSQQPRPPSLHRGEDVSPNVHNTPGAYRLGEGVLDENEEDIQEWQTMLRSDEQSQNQQQDYQAGTQLSGSSQDVEQIQNADAVPVGETGVEAPADSKPINRRMLWLLLGGGTAFIVVIVGIVVAVVMTQSSREVPPTEAPMPSASPSLAPTATFQPTRENGNWVQVGQPLIGIGAGDEFGNYLSFSGDGSIIAIASRMGTPGTYVQMYELAPDSNWAQLGTNLYFEAEVSVALSRPGTRVVIGVKGTQVAGRVIVYDWVGDNWGQVGSAIVGAAEASQYFGSGLSVSDDGSIIAVGDPDRSGGDDKENAGSASVFEFLNGEWKKVGKDIIGANAEDNFGGALSLSGDGKALAVGAIDNDSASFNAGHVRVFHFDGNEWLQMGGDIEGVRLQSGAFGSSVSLSQNGECLAIGDYLFDDERSAGGVDAGLVQVFTFEGTDWRQRGQNITGNSPFSHLGASVSISSDCSVVAVGIPRLQFADDQGTAQTYQFARGDWIELGSEVLGDLVGGNDFGWMVGLSTDGRVLAVSDPYDSNSTGFQAGSVQVYRIV